MGGAGVADEGTTDVDHYCQHNSVKNANGKTNNNVALVYGERGGKDKQQIWVACKDDWMINISFILTGSVLYLLPLHPSGTAIIEAKPNNLLTLSRRHFRGFSLT